MEATVADVETTPTQTPEKYTSRPGALIWSFRKSRDRWKSKYQDLKVTVKRLKNQSGRRHQEPRAVEAQGRASRRAAGRPGNRDRCASREMRGCAAEGKRTGACSR